MIIRRLLFALPLLIAGWIGTLAMVMAMGGASPAAFVPFPSASLIENLPPNIAITNRSAISLTLRSPYDDLPARLYAAGAWLVLPSGLEACIPDSLRTPLS